MTGFRGTPSEISHLRREVEALKARLGGISQGGAIRGDAAGFVTMPIHPHQNGLTGGLTYGFNARVYNSGNFSHNSSGNWLAITFDSERVDTDGIHSTSSNTSRLTCVTAGFYYIFGNFEFAANATNQRIGRIRLNATTVIAQTPFQAGNGVLSGVINISCLYQLAAGDYVELEGFQNSGGNLNILATANYSPEFGMALLR